MVHITDPSGRFAAQPFELGQLFFIADHFRQERYRQGMTQPGHKHALPCVEFPSEVLGFESHLLSKAQTVAEQVVGYFPWSQVVLPVARLQRRPNEMS